MESAARLLEERQLSGDPKMNQYRQLRFEEKFIEKLAKKRYSKPKILRKNIMTYSSSDCSL